MSHLRMKYIRPARISLFLTVSIFLNITVFAQANPGVDPAFAPLPTTNPTLQSGTPRYQADGKALLIVKYLDENALEINGIYRANSDGSLDNSFNCAACDFSISSLAIQPDGKIMVAGFSAGPKLIRLNSDGSLDGTFVSSTIPGQNAAVVYTVQADGSMYVSGRGSGGSGPSAFDVRTLYRMTSSGAMDNSFTPIVFDRHGNLSELMEIKVQSDGKLLIGGRHPWGPLFRANVDGTRDLTFSAPVITCTTCPGLNPANIQGFIVQPDGEIVVSGNFTTLNGIGRSYIGRLNTDGSVDNDYVPDLPLTGGMELLASKNMIAQADGRILISGPFTGPGFPTTQILRLNADGSTDNTFSAPSNIETFGLWTLAPDERILFFGEYNTGPNSFYRLNNDGSQDNTFSFAVRTPSAVTAVAAQADGKTIVAGRFKYMNGVARNTIARLNADGTLDESFTPGIGFTTQAQVIAPPTQLIVQPDGKVLASGGVFTRYDNAIVGPVVRLNADGTLDASFMPTVTNLNIIALQADGKILLGGGNIAVNGFSRTGIARLNSDGTLDTAFAPVIGTPSIVSLLVQPNGRIVLGGTFSGVAGFNRSNLARLNADGTCDTTFDAGSIGNMRHLTLQPDGKIIGIRNNAVLTRVNFNGFADATFVEYTFAGGSVSALALDNIGKILVGGALTAPRNYIARFNATGNLESAVLPSAADARVTSLAKQPDGKIVVGGYFKRFGNAPRTALARFDSAVPTRVLFDFDGDRRSDLGVFRQSSGTWYLMSSSSGERIQIFGTNGDKAVPADFNGDGLADLAIYRNGDWWWAITNSTSIGLKTWGTATDIPLPSDVDGDGKDDFVYYRPSTGQWFRSGSLGVDTMITFGVAGDQPVVADMDGDGKADPTIFRPSTGTWWYKSSVTNIDTSVQWGQNGDVPVAADYDGDGRTDAAVWRPSNGAWYVLNSASGSFAITSWGIAGDKPVPADYDGDGRADVAIWRPSNGVWFILQSTNGFTGMSYGISTDRALPNAFIPQ